MKSVEDAYKEHAQMVYKYLMTLTHNSQLAEELTQETFYQAVKSIHRFDYSCKITTWLCSIAKNQWMAYQRKHPDYEELDSLENLLSGADSIEKQFLEKQSYLEILRKLHNFPEPYREIMYLRFFGDLSFKEIADLLGKTENWARVTFYRGKERLRKEIENDEK